MDFKKDVLPAVVAGGLGGTLFYMLGGAVDAYVPGITAVSAAAIGFVGGAAAKLL